MTKYFIGIVGSLATAIAGAWLMVAPFALAYQPADAEWVDPTLVDFWTGLVILALSVIGLLMYSLGLVEELREIGVLERRQNQPSWQGGMNDYAPSAVRSGGMEGYPTRTMQPGMEGYPAQPQYSAPAQQYTNPEGYPPPAATATPANLEQILAPLVNAMLQDMQEHRPEANQSAGSTQNARVYQHSVETERSVQQ